MDQLLNDLKDLNNTNDPSVPLWAKLLIDSMVVVITELKCVKVLSQRIDELESFRVINENVSENLVNENKRLNDRINKLENSVDDQEQRNRNYCLLMHGVEENIEENTDTVVVETINNQLGLVDINLENIQRSHRLGPRNDGRSTRNNRIKPRPIIFRFRDFSARQQVFKNKKMLKGKVISISENLTKKRYTLYKQAMTKFGFRNVWTNEGRILTKIDNKIVVITEENL